MDILEEIKACADRLSVPIIKDEGAELLATCVGGFADARILEIGTGIGYSGIIMLNAAGGEATLTTIEIDGASAEIARGFFEKGGFSQRVRLIEGDAGEVLAMAEGKFDFIMLDGPKGQYEDFRPYLMALLKEGGVIFADNVLFKGYVYGDYEGHKHRTIVKSLRTFIKNMREDARVETVLHEVGDGILIAKKKKQAEE